MNQEEDECSFGKSWEYFSAGLQHASMGKLWGAVQKKSATLNLDKHIENPSACSLGNAVLGLCFQKALWLPSESWGRGGSCFAGWACGWEGAWHLVLASLHWRCLVTPTGKEVRSSEMEELFIYVLPDISKMPEQKPVLAKADAYWSCGSKGLGFLSFSEHLGFSLYRSSQLNSFNNVLKWSICWRFSHPALSAPSPRLVLHTRRAARSSVQLKPLLWDWLPWACAKEVGWICCSPKKALAVGRRVFVGYLAEGQCTVLCGGTSLCTAWQSSVVFKFEPGGLLDQSKPLEVFLCLSLGINSAEFYVCVSAPMVSG